MTTKRESAEVALDEVVSWLFEFSPEDVKVRDIEAVVAPVRSAIRKASRLEEALELLRLAFDVDEYGDAYPSQLLRRGSDQAIAFSERVGAFLTALDSETKGETEG